MGVVLVDCNLIVEVLEWVFIFVDEISVFVDIVLEFKVGKIKYWLVYIYILKFILLELEILWG